MLVTWVASMTTVHVPISLPGTQTPLAGSWAHFGNTLCWLEFANQIVQWRAGCRPFRLWIWVHCLTHLLRGLKFRFVLRCSSSPFGCGSVCVTGLTGPAMRLGQTAWMHETWQTHKGQMLWLQAPWGCSNCVEMMTTRCNRNKAATVTLGWCDQSCDTIVVLFDWCSEHDTWRGTHDNALADCWVNDRGSPHERDTRDWRQKRHATNGVDKLRLDGLAQRKHVEIHRVRSGNEWMGSLTLMIKQHNKVEQLAGASKQ